MQRLLAERFNFQSHWEMRTSPVYALKVAKSGPKIHKSPNPPDDKTLSISITNGPDGWSLHDRLPTASPKAPFGITVAKLVQYFNNNSIFDRMVVDETGLDGYYDLNLQIKPDAGTPPDAEMFIDALASQLGLTLQKQTAPVNTLIVDRIDTSPVPN